MNPDELATAFEQHRPRLRAVAYRMLGNPDDADDALQEAWLRLNRTGDAEIDNLAAWLTTVTGRICLDMLRSRSTRREAPLPTGLPDDLGPELPHDDVPDPAQEAELADVVGLAMQIVLQSLDPAERLAFVLHDLFAVPLRADRAGAGPLGRRVTSAREPRTAAGAVRCGGSGCRRDRFPDRCRDADRPTGRRGLPHGVPHG